MVEINNTDAEGRVILGDDVAYAWNNLKADWVVDMATLTVAQVREKALLYWKCYNRKNGNRKLSENPSLLPIFFFFFVHKKCLEFFGSWLCFQPTTGMCYILEILMSVSLCKVVGTVLAM